MTLTILISTGILILVQIVKKYIKPKFGDVGIHIFILAVALIIVGVQSAATVYPGLQQFIIKAAEYLAGAITLYEVIFKKISDQIGLY